MGQYSEESKASPTKESRRSPRKNKGNRSHRGAKPGAKHSDNKNKEQVEQNEKEPIEAVVDWFADAAKAILTVGKEPTPRDRSHTDALEVTQSDDDETPQTTPRREDTQQVAPFSVTSPSKTMAPSKSVAEHCEQPPMAAPPKRAVPSLNLSSLKPNVDSAQKPVPLLNLSTLKPNVDSAQKQVTEKVMFTDEQKKDAPMKTDVQAYHDIGSPKTTQTQQRRKFQLYMRLVNRHKAAVATGDAETVERLEEVIARTDVPAELRGGEDEVWEQDWTLSEGDLLCLTARLRSKEMNDDDDDDARDAQVKQSEPEDDLWSLDWSKLEAA
jgi:hypothetical protein